MEHAVDDRLQLLAHLRSRIRPRVCASLGADSSLLPGLCLGDGVCLRVIVFDVTFSL
jgi:hypothetical protein